MRGNWNMISRLLSRVFLSGLAAPAVAASATAAGPAYQQAHPHSRLTPGGSTDVVARLLANPLTETSASRSSSITGRAGGSSAPRVVARGARRLYVALAPPLAYHQLLLQRKLPYIVERDFAPISLVVVNPQVPVGTGLAANTIVELLKLARSRPGQINYASPGVGSPNHMGMELLKAMTGIDLVHVPYKGGAPASTDLIAGQVSLLFNSIPSVLQHMRSGRLKALAVGSAVRSPAIPEIPTVAEAGVPGFEYATWYGLFAPAGTSREIIARLNAAAGKALLAPELAQPLRAQGSSRGPRRPKNLHGSCGSAFAGAVVKTTAGPEVSAAPTHRLTARVVPLQVGT